MIEIRIQNHATVARSRRRIARFLPASILRSRVEEALAERLRENLADEGIEAEIRVVDG